MPTLYCSFCPAKMTYEAVKPTKCPKCGKAIASAFTVAPLSTASSTVAASQFDDLEDATSAPRNPLRGRPTSTTVAKSRFRHGQELPPIGGVQAGAGPGTDEDDDDENEDYVDPRMRRRLARELAATIDPNTIRVDDEDEHPTTFATIWNDPKAAAAREKGVNSSSKRSRKR